MDNINKFSVADIINIIHQIIIILYLLYSLKIIYKYFKYNKKRNLIWLIKKLAIVFLYYVPVSILFSIIEWWLLSCSMCI